MFDPLGACSLGPVFVELPYALFECRYVGVVLFFFFGMLLIITSRAFRIIPFDVTDKSWLQAIRAGLISFFIFPVADGATDFHTIRIPRKVSIGICIEPAVFVVDGERYKYRFELPGFAVLL
jgi:hypothetical protein